MKTVTMGSFYNADSPLHRMDPRVKTLLTIVFMVSVFWAQLPWGMLVVAALLCLMVALSRVPLRVVARACRPVWIFVLLTVIANLLMAREGKVFFHIFGLAVTDASLYDCALMGLRIFGLMLCGVMYSLTTSPVAITDGMERLLAPLARLGVPVHEFAMMFSIALRFVPTLAQEAGRIMTAQASRGAAVDEGGLVERVRAFVPILVPLFGSALRHAEELADAMESRCYTGSEGRTHYHVLQLRRVDYLGIGVFAVYLAAVAVLAAVL